MLHAIVDCENFAFAKHRSKVDCIGINEFEVQVRNIDMFNEPVSFYMRREGLGGWKVDGISVPDSLVEKLLED